MGMLDFDGPDFGSGYDQYSGMSGFQGNPQPGRPSFLNAFQAGIQQNPKKNKILAGLSGQAGSGGFMGGLGDVAKFLI